MAKRLSYMSTDAAAAPKAMLADEADPVGKTGCQELNDAVLLCWDEHRDWRKCVNEVRSFKECFEAYKRRES